MAGLTDSAFRRLVKRHGGCGLVVTEMVSSEGLVRGIDRTLEYAGFTEEERPVAVQIFGGDPGKMALAAQVVEPGCGVRLPWRAPLAAGSLAGGDGPFAGWRLLLAAPAGLTRTGRRR